MAAAAPAEVNKVLKLPLWHWSHDQGYEGSCVGHGAAMERAIVNTAQRTALRYLRKTVRYDPLHIWNEAKKIDEWDDTNPGDSNGTSVRAAYDVLRTQGASRVEGMDMSATNVPFPVGPQPPERGSGIRSNKWATTVDEMRACILRGQPVTIGVNWYSEFDRPEGEGREFWVARDGRLTTTRGGHCVCVYGASDRRQAFRFKNSWGEEYPLCWLPYSVMERLLGEWGEATVVTDR